MNDGVTLTWEWGSELEIFSNCHCAESKFSTILYHRKWWPSPAYHEGSLVFPHRALWWCISLHFHHYPTDQGHQNKHFKVMVGGTYPLTQTSHSSLQSDMHEGQLVNCYYVKWGPYLFPSTFSHVLSVWDSCNFALAQCTWVFGHMDSLWAQWSQAVPCTMPNKSNQHKETRFNMIGFYTFLRSAQCLTVPPVAKRIWLELQLLEEQLEHHQYQNWD